MIFALGVIAFALCLLASIAWHECGHMWAAQATGMRVRRYFVGFGPTVWSFRRGRTEYGLKAIPAGGFCDIAGMTTYDELSAADAPYAMYRQAAWKRLVVLVAGPVMNFILAFVIIVGLAVAWGLPDLHGHEKVYASELSCVPATVRLPQPSPAPAPDCSGAGPAAAAGIRLDDRIIAVNGATVNNSDDLVNYINAAPVGPVNITVHRGDTDVTMAVTPATTTQITTAADGAVTRKDIRRIGVSMRTDNITTYSGVDAIGGAVVFTGNLARLTWDALISMPTKVHDLWTAVTGGQRADDTPVSVVGASRLGGEAADHQNWPFFFFLLASINFFLGLFNLVPLLPLDGGHMAIVGYEKVRDGVRRLLGRPAGGPVDYLKLMPATYAVLAVMGTYMVLTLAADIVNPIKVF